MTFTAYVMGTEQANGHSVIPAWAKPNFDSSGTLGNLNSQR